MIGVTPDGTAMRRFRNIYDGFGIFVRWEEVTQQGYFFGQRNMGRAGSPTSGEREIMQRPHLQSWNFIQGR